MDYIAMKIHEIMNKVVGYFKPNEHDPYEAIEMLENLTLSRHVFLSESVDDYLSRKRSVKKKFILLILQTCTWICILKSLFLSYYNTRTLSIMTGDFTYLYPRPDILNVTSFVILAAVAIIGENNLFFS